MNYINTNLHLSKFNLNRMKKVLDKFVSTTKFFINKFAIFPVKY